MAIFTTDFRRLKEITCTVHNTWEIQTDGSLRILVQHRGYWSNTVAIGMIREKSVLFQSQNLIVEQFALFNGQSYFTMLQGTNLEARSQCVNTMCLGGMYAAFLKSHNRPSTPYMVITMAVHTGATAQCCLKNQALVLVSLLLSMVMLFNLTLTAPIAFMACS